MITTITGDNTFFRTQKLAEIVAAFNTNHEEIAIERIDGEETTAQRLVESLTGFSLFSVDKLVIVRVPSAQKSFVENIATIANAIPETTKVVVLEPKLDKRTAYYKYLKKNTNIVQCDMLAEYHLSVWITEVVKSHGGSINIPDARYLIARIGIDQQQLYAEITKLLAYDSHISKENINLLTDQSPQGSVFELLDVAFAGKTKSALTLYQSQRQQKIEPLSIVGMLAWQMHVIATVKAGKDIGDSVIAKDAGINPYVVSKSRAIAKRMSRDQLKSLVSRLLQLDIDLKSKTRNADDVVSQFIIELSETAKTAETAKTIS